MEFIVASSILFAETYKIEPNTDREYIKNVASSIDVPVFVPKSGMSVKVKVNES